MFNPFRLKQPIGEAYNMDLDDSLNTKTALADLGHMKIPEHGLTEFPDRPMIDGVKSFQREQGLAVDGVMKPDGPTIERLNRTLAGKQSNPPKSIFGPRPINNKAINNPKPAVQTLPATPQVRAGAVKRTRERREDDPPAVVTPFDGKPPSVAKAKSGSLFQPINLKRPITPATNVDLNDTGRVKKALHDLGLLDTRDHGLDEFPDQPMIDGIKSFQRQQGLREDGEMKPDGETVQRLNQVMAARDEESTQVAQAAQPKSTGGQAKSRPASPAHPAPANPPTQLSGTPSVAPPAMFSTLDKQGKFQGAKDPFPQSRESAAFRNKIHQKESAAGNYSAVNKHSGALGRYQMTDIALKEIGLKDRKTGQWTGKYGVRSQSDFLNNPKAQEQAVSELHRAHKVQLETNGAWAAAGNKQTITGVKGPITVTEAGLLAAAHRQGAKAVREYLNHVSANKGGLKTSNLDKKTEEKFLAIETRMREFQNVPLRP